MAISQRERFVEGIMTLFDDGITTKAVVHRLTSEPLAIDSVVTFPHGLRKSQATNLVRQVRKKMGILMPLGDAGNYQLQRDAEIHKARQAKLEKSFNVSKAVIKKNHQVKPCITDADADRILAEEQAQL